MGRIGNTQGTVLCLADLIDTDYIYEIITKEEFLRFNQEVSLDNCLDVEDKARVRVIDEEAKMIIAKISKCKNATEFQYLKNNFQEKYIKKFYDKGISIRQISRLCGVSKGKVEKCVADT